MLHLTTRPVRIIEKIIHNVGIILYIELIYNPLYFIGALINFITTIIKETLWLLFRPHIIDFNLWVSGALNKKRMKKYKRHYTHYQFFDVEPVPKPNIKNPTRFWLVTNEMEINKHFRDKHTAVMFRNRINRIMKAQHRPPVYLTFGEHHRDYFFPQKYDKIPMIIGG